MIISQNGAVDLIPEYNRALRPIFCVSEGDANSRTINLTVTSAGEVFTIPEGAEVYVAGKKQDNTIFTYQCAYSGYIVSFPVAEQMSAANGLVLCELQIVVAGDPLGSANFCYWVEPSPIANGSSSESDLNIFEQAIAALGGYEYLTSEVSVLSARMDQFARLPDGSLSTAADAELADVRVKANGQTAATAGDAVREQITELKNDLITGDPFTQSDIIRGSFNGQMQPVVNNARLRVGRVLNVFRGQHLTFTEGTVIKQMLVGYFSTTGVYIRDSQYYNTGAELIFDDDYKIIIVFRKDASTTINITDYDAITKLSPIPMSVRSLLSDLAQPLGFYGTLRFYKTSVSHSSAIDRLYCDISSGTEFYIRLKRATNNWIYFYAYDSSGNTGGNSIASTNQQEILLKATAPFDIKSIGIADSSTNVGWYEVTAYSVDSAIVTSGQGLEIATNARDSIANLVIDGDAQNLYSESNATVGYLNTSGSIGTDNVNNRTTDYIPVGDNTYITVQTWMELPSGVTQWQAVCFYDANKSLIGSRNVKTGGTDSYAYYTVAIPSTAIYARVASRAYNNYKIMVQFGDVATAFQNGQDDISTIIKAQLNPKSNDLYVKSINHRGWVDAPENTIPAFIASKQHGYNYVETDIAFTSDGVAVLLHDNTINRTARNADGTTISGEIDISGIAYEQALQYDFGIYKGSEYAGTKIPTLTEFLTLCKKLALRPYLELKSGATYTSAQIQSVVDIVKDFDMLSQTTFISFSFYYLRAVKEYAPTARISRITTSPTEAWFTDEAEGLLLLRTGQNEVFADSSSYGSDVVALCKLYNIPLEIWTINTVSDIATMDGYISGVTTDKLIASTILEDAALT